MATASLRSTRTLLFPAFLLGALMLPGRTFAQRQPNPDALSAAEAKVSGGVVGGKDGPLAKVGMELALASEEYRQHLAGNATAAFAPSSSLVRVIGDRVAVEVIADIDPVALESELRAMGMQVTGRAGAMVSGLLPLSAIEAVAAAGNVRFARPAMCATAARVATSQGDSAMHATVMRRVFGLDGHGVTVGVLSDSYNTKGGAATDISNGDLPGPANPEGFTTPVTIVQEAPVVFSDEGRAMLQIVHRVAPASTLAFATAFTGQAAFANNIQLLRTSAGAGVIVDDVFYYAEPFFQDGVIAQSVRSTVAAGVPYVVLAGNFARESYESVWRSGPVIASGTYTGFAGGTTFDFDPGPGVQNLQSFTLAAGNTVTISLQWDSPFASVCSGCPGSPNDLDLYIFNGAGTQIVASGKNRNVNNDAVEVVSYTNPGATALFNLMIVNFAGPDPGFLKHINLSNGAGHLANLAFATNSSTLYGHMNSDSAITVGAAPWFGTPAWGVTPPVKESFSSSGPTAIRFTTTGDPTSDPRSFKPDIIAPDGTSTSVYNPFYGTSAASPHAAAVIALIRQANGAATPSQIRSALQASGIDMGPAGFDNDNGFGLLQAENSIPGMPLPVTLSSFTGRDLLDGAVQLNWRTESEISNYGFEVQRSHDVQGGFLDLPNGFVPGHGTTLVRQEYSFVDGTAGSGKWAYRLKQIDLDGMFRFTEPVLVDRVTGIQERSTPVAFALSANYPNPFNPTTIISYQLPVASPVKLAVYDLIGREVAVLVNEQKAPGMYEVRFDGSLLSSGMYFYRLQEGNNVATKTMMLLK